MTRGANINYCSVKTGLTPLHVAIEARLSQKIIRYLLNKGADPHIEDANKQDCCDKVKDVQQYKDIKELHSCQHSKKVSFDEAQKKNQTLKI